MPGRSSPRRARTDARAHALCGAPDALRGGDPSAHTVGLVETLGYTAAVQALDAAVKGARVNVIGYDLTRGNGWVCMEIRGEVAAVQAAVDAARAWAARVGQVVAAPVIARPDEETVRLIGAPAAGAPGARPGAESAD